MNSDKLKNEYPALFTISTLCIVVGIIIILIAVIALIYGFSLLGGYGYEKSLGVTIIISALLGGFLSSIIFFSYSELIKIFARIEFNTRKDNTEEIIKRLENKEQKKITVNSDNTEISYKEWKQENPGKSINDYYIARQTKH